MVAARGRGLRVERAPEPRPANTAARVAVIGALSFATGLAFVVWNAGGVRRTSPRVAAPAAPHDSGEAPEPTDETPSDPQDAPEVASAAPDDEAGEAHAPEPTPGFVVVDDDGGVPVRGDVPSSDVPAADLTAESAVPTATPHTGPRRVERGRVAYLRCDGVPQRPGPFPCPRDEALETAVWNVLETLPRCAEAPPGLGESDVRLEFAPDRPTVARLRAPRPDVPRLDGAAVLRCVAGPLSHLTSAGGATRLMLAFRFALVDAAAPRGDARPRATP